MIHGNYTKNIIDYSKYYFVVTNGNYNSRYSFLVKAKIDLNNKQVIIETENKLDERITLSFISSKYEENIKNIDKGYNKSLFTPIYDSDSFVSYLKESDFVYKLKQIKDNIYQITSFLVKENEN
jgi:hypothetical protein